MYLKAWKYVQPILNKVLVGFSSVLRLDCFKREFYLIVHFSLQALIESIMSHLFFSPCIILYMHKICFLGSPAVRNIQIETNVTYMIFTPGFFSRR